MKRHDDGRAVLLAAARRVAASGLGARISLRDIAKEAGYSPAACYRYYASREHLVDALLVQIAEEIVTQAGGAAASEQGPEDKVIAAALAYLRFAIANRGVFHLAFGPGEGQWVGEARREGAAMLADMFGDLANRPDLGACLWAGVHGMVDLLLKGMIDVGQQEQGVHVLASRGETLLRGLIEQMTTR